VEHGIATKFAWPRRFAAVVVGAAALASPFVAGAQEQPSISLNRFHQTPAGDHFYGVPSPHVGEHLGLELMASANYAHDPLVLLMETEDGDESVGSLVRHLAFLHLNGGMGLFDRLSVNLNIPVVMLQSGKVSPSDRMGYVSPDTSQLGDLRLGLRVRLFGERRDALQVGLGGYLWFPTGAIDTPSYVSDGSVRGMPQLLAGGQIDGFLWTLATGPEVRESQDFGPTPQNSIWVWGAGVGMLLGEDQDWQVGAETTVSIDMTDPVTHNTNGEWLMSGKWRFIENMENGIGFGTGYTQGMGTPDFRAIVSLAYRSEQAAASKDRDGDGIDDGADACPDAAGAPNPDPAKHGCPDRDGDGIVDRLDACAYEPGVQSEDPATNGCPPDRDGDRIGDEQDACPDQPGEPNEDPLKHGCPQDRDGDGITDSDDACPDQPGEPSPDPATNGCPVDRDMDGVPDGQDACPDVAGEASDDPARNGCPPDRDGDGILDTVDACPDKKGIAQDDPAKNGCPLVEVTAGEVVITPARRDRHRAQGALGAEEDRGAGAHRLDGRQVAQHPPVPAASRRREEGAGRPRGRGRSAVQQGLRAQQAHRRQRDRGGPGRQPPGSVQDRRA